MTAGRRQRLHSPASAVVSRGVGEDAPVRPGEADLAGDRRGQLQVVGQVDAGVRDVVDPVRAEGVAEEARDVPGERSVAAEALIGPRSRPGGRGGVLRLVLPVALVEALPSTAPAAAVSTSAARRSSSRAMPFLMLWSVFRTSPSRPSSTLTAYSSAPRRISSASPWALVDDLAALGLGGLGEATLVDEEGRLLLGPGDDALRLLLGLLDDPLALGVDALGRADLLGHGDAQLVDEAEGGVLVDDHVRRQRQLLAVGDQRLEALDEEDDVDGRALLTGGVAVGTVAAWDRPRLSHAGDGSAAGQSRPERRDGRPRAPSPTRRHRSRRSP